MTDRKTNRLYSNVSLILLFLCYSFIGFAQDAPTIDGDLCDIAAWGPAVGEDNIGDTPTATADVVSLYHVQVADTLYWGWIRAALGTGTSSFNLLFDIDCDSNTDIVVEMVWNNDVELEVSINGTMIRTALQGESVCGDPNTQDLYAEYFFTIDELIQFGEYDPCTCDCGSVELVGSGSFAGGSFNSALRDGFDILNPNGTQFILNGCPNAEFTQTDVTCVNTEIFFDGSISIDDFPPNEMLTYMWDFGDGATSTLEMPSHVYTTTGNYTVSLTVTDQYMCTDVEMMMVTVNPGIEPTCTFGSDVSCAGMTDGQATVSATGGDGNYTYLWDNMETAAMATALSAGVHSVTVTDGAGCTAMCMVTIGESPSLVPTCSLVSDVVCIGDSNGSATVTVTGGNGGESYLWDNGETTQTAAMLAAGTHTVLVTDANGCSASCSVDIGEPLAISCTIQAEPMLTLLGSATIMAVGGDGVYAYTWDNGETTQTATMLTPGPHTATVTDGALCTTTCTVTIDNPPDASITLMKTGTIMDPDGPPVMPGDIISYSFEVCNTSTVDITNVMVTDPLITVTGSLTFLAANSCDDFSFSGMYVIQLDDINNGGLMNTASVVGTGPAGDVTDTDDDFVELLGSPAIELVKIGLFNDENGDGFGQVGETVSYIFNVMNTGTVTVTNISVSDPVITVSGAPIATLAPGESDNTSFSGVYTLTLADINNGSFTNTAIATGTDTNGNAVTDDDTEIVEFPQNPEIMVMKTGTFNDENGDGLTQVGETISFSFIVMNSGSVTLTNILITDPLVSITGGPISLMPMETDNTTFMGSYTITLEDINNGMLSNTATASGNDPNGNPVTDTGTEQTNLPGMPELNIVKIGTFNDENGDGFGQPGETIGYNFVVSNTGTISLTNVTVADPNVVVIGGPIPNLNPGDVDNSTFSATYTLTQLDIDNGGFTNTAIATGIDPNGNEVTDETMEMTDIPANPAVDIIKSSVFNDENNDGIAQPGETILYTFTITNTGNVTLNNISIVDPFITTLGGPINNLLPGQIDNTTFSGSYPLMQSDIDAGQVFNQVLVSAQDPAGMTVTDSDMNEQQIPQEPGISILKAGTFNDENGDGFTQVGETITFSFIVTNTGNVTLNNIMINDPIISIVGGPITLIPLEMNSSSFQGTYTITLDDINNGTLANTATATGTDPNGNPTTATATEDTNLPGNPELSIVKIGTFNDENGDGYGQPGETISYIFVVTNSGTVSITNVGVTDPNVEVIGGPIPVLNPGDVDNTTFSGTYTLSQADVDNGEFTNIAITSGIDPDGNEIMEETTEMTAVPENPGINIIKSSMFRDENNDGIAQPGETIFYSFTITNTGNVTITNITIDDPFIITVGGPIGSLLPGQTDNTTFSGIYTITQSDIDVGEVYNEVLVSAQDPDGTTVTDSDMNDQLLPQDPDISLLKTGAFQDENGDGFGQPGETITYAFTVTNTGNVTLTDVTIIDPLVTIIGTPIAVLSPGQSNSTAFTGIYTISQIDIDNGGFENIALGVGTDPNGNETTDQSDDPQNPTDDDPDGDGDPDDPTITSIGQNPLIMVQKMGSFQDENDDDLAQLGETITYTFLITNTGNVTLMDISIFDALINVTGTLPILAPGESDVISITGAYALTTPDLNNELVNNTATVTASDPNGDPVTDTDIEIINFIVAASVSGQVTADTDQDLFGDQNLENVLIELIDSRGDTLTTRTDVNGNYSFANSVFPGPITIIENDPGDYVSLSDVDGGDPNIIFTSVGPGGVIINQDFLDAICDELVCNGDLQISLNLNCELVLTADMVLENTSPGKYKIRLYDSDNNFLRCDTLTAAEAGQTIKYEVSCGGNSCWGEIIVEANIIPQLESPCSCTEDGTIPEECSLWCTPSGSVPGNLISVEEAAAAFGNCGPDLLGDITVEETRTGEICDEGGEIVEVKYSGKVILHGTIRVVEILCQRYSTMKLEVSENSIFFPRDVELDCDYLNTIVTPEGEDPQSYDFGSPESILASTGSGNVSYPYFIDMHDTILNVVELYDTIQVVIGSSIRDTMVQELIGGEEFWVLETVVDKVYGDSVVVTLDTIGKRNPEVLIQDRICNVLVGYSDVEFDACGQGTKILRQWNILDWCDSDVTITATQTIEIKDQTPPRIVELLDGEYVDVSVLPDVIANTDPWSCTARVAVPDLHTIDNCAEEVTVKWYSDEGEVRDGYLVDLWLSQSPILVFGEVYDDCGNVTEVSFSVVVVDDVPPVPICESGLQVSVTGSINSGDFGYAKVYAEDLDEGSHDSGCGKVTISVIRKEDREVILRNCDGLIVGYEPISCQANTLTTDLGVDNGKGCSYSEENDKVTVAIPGEYVTFCCEDVGKIVPVILIIEDQNGNVNECIVDIEVVDKQQPTIICEDQTITCYEGDKLVQPAMVGASCEGEKAYEVLLLGEDRGSSVCAGGQVVREWYLDLNGDGEFSTGDSYCSQIISVYNDSKFDPHTIKWPKSHDSTQEQGINLECTENSDGDIIIVETPNHTVQMGEALSCMPDDIVDFPVWCDTDCGLVGYSMDTDTIFASDACLKVLRRWTVVDWCTYNPNSGNIDDENDGPSDTFVAVEDWAQGECAACPEYGPVADAVYLKYNTVDDDGYYTYDQLIKVVDDTRPAIEVVTDFVVSTTSGSETKDDAPICIGEATVTARASDFCGGNMTGANLLQWEITVSENGVVLANKNVRGAEAEMNSQSGSPGDIHMITWRVKDGCGNEISATTRVTFGDAQAPTPFCVSGLSTAYMDSDGSVTVWGNEFDFGSFDNCTESEDLRWSIVRRGVTPLHPDDTAFGVEGSITFQCQNFSNFEDLDVWVWDNDGNGDFCSVSIILGDNQFDCPSEGGQGGAGVLVGGQVSTSYGTMIDDVAVTIHGSRLSEFPKTEMTNEFGEYNFSNNPLFYNYELNASKDDEYINGLSTLDIVFITQHIIGNNIMSDPYKILASDVNGDGRISVSDITEFRRLILARAEGFTNMSPWLFVKEDHSFFDEQNPWPFVENIEINELTSELNSEDFIGIKLGDVNESVTIGNNLVSSEKRTDEILALTIRDRHLEKGERVKIALTSAEFKHVHGYQFTLQHKGLSFTGIESGALTIDENNIGQNTEFMTMSWNDVEAITTTESEVLFTLEFEAVVSLSLKDVIKLNSTQTRAEAYVGDLFEIQNIQIEFINELEEIELYQNKPNPFAVNTTIGFNLPKQGEAMLTVHNIMGVEVKRVIGNYKKGYNEIVLSHADIPEVGLFYYRLTSGKVSTQKRMILVD